MTKLKPNSIEQAFEAALTRIQYVHGVMSEAERKAFELGFYAGVNAEVEDEA